jgi:hypothetical protein
VLTGVAEVTAVLGFKTVLTTGDGQDARGCDRGHSRAARSRKGGGRGGAGAMRGDARLKGHGSQAGVGGGGDRRKAPRGEEVGGGVWPQQQRGDARPAAAQSRRAHAVQGGARQGR